MTQNSKKCGDCGEIFKSYSPTKRFCSAKCRKTSQSKNKLIINCCNCGKVLTRHKSVGFKRGKLRTHFCSAQCKINYYKGERGTGYKCGKYISPVGHVMILVDGIYRAEHRIVAEGIIGRPLNFWEEPILHIDGVGTNNSPENLYICMNMSEMAHILNNYDVPYPVKSNIYNFIQCR